MDPAGRNGWAASSKGVLHLSDGEWRAHQDGSRVFATESPPLLLSKDATRGLGQVFEGLFRLDSLLGTAPKAQARRRSELLFWSPRSGFASPRVHTRSGGTGGRQDDHRSRPG